MIQKYIVHDGKSWLTMVEYISIMHFTDELLVGYFRGAKVSNRVIWVRDDLYLVEFIAANMMLDDTTRASTLQNLTSIQMMSMAEEMMPKMRDKFNCTTQHVMCGFQSVNSYFLLEFDSDADALAFKLGAVSGLLSSTPEFGMKDVRDSIQLRSAGLDEFNAR